ncbi:hypothetical protein AB0M29_20530 [Streptomyces sp. NPDC051976]|uniref:hypothetical protein n=1 Tax=Streptomyces sp. NPDC051976 TaxID=3154947 RepID=UPI00344A50F0
MADVVLSVLLLAAAAAALLLAQRALRHWWAQRAGRPYELRVDHRGTVVWSGAAVVAAAVAIALAVPLLSGPAAAPAPRVVVATAAAPVTAPPAPPRTPAPAPPPPELRTLGHPSGGTLQELRAGIRVWTPPWYDSKNAAHLAYPVVVADVPADGADEVYDGFARQAKRGRSDPFLVVMPRDCGQDTGTVLAEVARQYRVLSATTARGVLGAGAGAPCAVREAFAHPDRFGAAAGLSGSYPPPLPTPGAVRPPLLLASVTGAPTGRGTNRDLRDALHAHGDQVRVIDGVSARRGELYALAAAYLTEKLDGPTRVAAGALPPNPPPVSTPTPSAPRAGAQRAGTPGPTTRRLSAPRPTTPTASARPPRPPRIGTHGLPQ